MRRKKKKLIIIIASIIAGIAIVSFFDRGAARRKPIDVTGIVEADEINISPEVSGRIVRLAREGERVSRGQLVVSLEDAKSEAELARAKAALEARKDALAEGHARLDALTHRHQSADAEIAASKAERQRAKVTLTDSEKEAGRVKTLFERGYASERQADLTRTKAEEAKAAVDVFEAQVARSEARLKEIASEIKAQKKAISTLESQVKEAEAAVRLYQARLDDTKILSPADGLVVYSAFRVGETVTPNQVILTIINPLDRWARIDIDETFIGRIKIGDALQVRAGGVEEVFAGKLFEIGREAEFATQRDVTRGKQDIKTFRVKLRLEDPQETLKPGMTVIVRIP